MAPKLLLIYNPYRSFKGSLHEMVYEALKSTGIEVDYLDIENPPVFKNQYWPDKIRNIYERKFLNNKLYYIVAENNFHNRFFLKQLKKHIDKGKKYDYVLIIKPEEYSPQFIKTASELGNKTVGYIWDGLRLFFKPNILKSRKYLDELYSFDANNINDHADLNMKFLTNFYIADDETVPFDKRKTDVFYVGALAGTLDSQRRDWKLHRLVKYLNGNLDININVSPEFLEKDKKKVSDKRINYTTEFLSLFETMKRTKNSRIVIDICKKHHKGLSFRFFECLNYEVKIITNNEDVINYDFYHPDNILIVDFDEIDKFEEQIIAFQNIPYHSIDPIIKEKYEVKNWEKVISGELPSDYQHKLL